MMSSSVKLNCVYIMTINATFDVLQLFCCYTAFNGLTVSCGVSVCFLLAVNNSLAGLYKDFIAQVLILT